MFTKLRLMLALAVLGIVVGGAFAVASSDAQAKPIQFQTADILAFQDTDGMTELGFFELEGAAHLTRDKGGISYRIYTTGLEPGTYTIWIAVFNKPENCIDGCDGSDMNIPEVQGSVVHGSGLTVGEDGIANFSGSLDTSGPLSGVQVNVPVGTVNGLRNAMKAEVHLVVRAHGPAIAGLVDMQTSKFGGGCNNTPPETGTPGPFTCYDPQLAVFPAP